MSDCMHVKLINNLTDENYREALIYVESMYTGEIFSDKPRVLLFEDMSIDSILYIIVTLHFGYKRFKITCLECGKYSFNHKTSPNVGDIENMRLLAQGLLGNFYTGVHDESNLIECRRAAMVHRRRNYDSEKEINHDYKVQS